MQCASIAMITLLGLLSLSGTHVARAAASTPQKVGAIVAIGGGGTTDAIVKRTLELAGGAQAIVAVLPQASEEPDAGDESVEMWREAGAREARKIDFTDLARAKVEIERSTLIWMPGGDQTRLVKALAAAGMDDVIRERHRAGAVVGGTSAGAAALSKVMITGDADLTSLSAGSTVTIEGLGLLTDVIVDQHFLKRQRHNRLQSLVLDKPALVGLGIDEATAAIFEGSTITVLGRSAVVMIDARHADVTRVAAGEPVAARDVKVTILRDGMTVSLR